MTFNTHCGKALFGTIVNGRMVLNEAGRIAEEEWRKSALLRKNIALDEHVIYGFPSPMERALFRAGLRNGKPMIWVKPWGLADSADDPAVRLAVDEARLLIVSPFDDTVDAPAVRRAAWCNQYVLAHCDRMVIGHLNPDGMLACILSEADPDKEIVYVER